MLYYTTDEFVCVLPSAITEGGNKSHQRILAFVLAKAQVTASTGKRGKCNTGHYLRTSRIRRRSGCEPLRLGGGSTFYLAKYFPKTT